MAFTFRLNIFHIQDDCAPVEGNYLQPKRKKMRLASESSPALRTGTGCFLTFCANKCCPGSCTIGAILETGLYPARMKPAPWAWLDRSEENRANGRGKQDWRGGRKDSP